VARPSVHGRIFKGRLDTRSALKVIALAIGLILQCSCDAEQPPATKSIHHKAVPSPHEPPRSDSSRSSTSLDSVRDHIMESIRARRFVDAATTLDNSRNTLPFSDLVQLETLLKVAIEEEVRTTQLQVQLALDRRNYIQARQYATTLEERCSDLFGTGQRVAGLRRDIETARGFADTPPARSDKSDVRSALNKVRDLVDSRLALGDRTGALAAVNAALAVTENSSQLQPELLKILSELEQSPIPAPPRFNEQRSPEDPSRLKEVIELTQATATHLAREDWREAIRMATSWISAAPRSAEAYLSRAKAFLGEGNLWNAMQDVERAIALHSGSWEAHFLKGVLLQKNEDHDLAALAFTEAISADPTRSQPYMWRAESSVRLGSWIHVIPDLDTSATIDPDLRDEKRWVTCRIQAFLGLGNHQKGLSLCNAWLATNNQDSSILLLKVRLHMIEGDTKAALRACEAALAADTSSEEAALLKAELEGNLARSGPPKGKVSIAEVKELVKSYLQAERESVLALADGTIRLRASFDCSREAQLRNFSIEGGRQIESGLLLEGTASKPSRLTFAPLLTPPVKVVLHLEVEHPERLSKGFAFEMGTGNSSKDDGAWMLAGIRKADRYEFYLEATDGELRQNNLSETLPKKVTIGVSLEGKVFSASLGSGEGLKGEGAFTALRIRLSSHERLVVNRIELEADISPSEAKWLLKIPDFAWPWRSGTSTSLLTVSDQQPWDVQGLTLRQEKSTLLIDSLAGSGLLFSRSWVNLSTGSSGETEIEVQEMASLPMFGLAFTKSSSGPLEVGDICIQWSSGRLGAYEWRGNQWTQVANAKVSSRISKSTYTLSYRILDSGIRFAIRDVGELHIPSSAIHPSRMRVGLRSQHVQYRVTKFTID